MDGALDIAWRGSWGPRSREGILSSLRSELLGHESVETTQIYTHVMTKAGLASLRGEATAWQGVKSPLDG